MCLWTTKNFLNFGCHAPPDPVQEFFEGVLNVTRYGIFSQVGSYTWKRLIKPLWKYNNRSLYGQGMIDTPDRDRIPFAWRMSLCYQCALISLCAESKMRKKVVVTLQIRNFASDDISARSIVRFNFLEKINSKNCMWNQEEKKSRNNVIESLNNLQIRRSGIYKLYFDVDVNFERLPWVTNNCKIEWRRSL